ncbi:MAG TPA: CocE/NonD family hydrolase [Acidimicrobiia bacterium]|nr:CocE/NonD family hydrolase [Acidimicrobiia bacterium]
MRHVDIAPVIEDENVWIPLSDGTRLAARIWRPADQAPVPAIFEYLPYRKRYGTVARDSLTHPYLAANGYAGVRVDIRGSGESDGVLTDEYLQSELDDGVAAIDWIASQPWCDGTVGMMGISWGGFNGLQIAALRPEPLKAVMTICSTDDRYADDIHHMGGCLLTDNLSWASVMFAYNTMPPDPAIVGDRWREMWFERLEGSGLWLENWLHHQRRDDFWRHGSICEDYAAITVPVYAVSGWADGYSNAVFRLLANLDVPRKGLVGPWSHAYPHIARPEPAIGFLQELLRWWDHWLKGIDTGIMDEPMVRTWMQEAIEPDPAPNVRPGRWVAETSWPSPRIAPRAFGLHPDGRLVENGEGSGVVSISSPLWVGRQAGKWCSYGDGPDQPGDQRTDDSGSQIFDTGPLTDAIEILGAPMVDLHVTSDRPIAQVAVRLCAVDPEGRSTRVSYGVLNLTHRDSHAEPEPLTPGQPTRISVRLNEVAQIFPAGQRIRLAVSTSYWPLIWPAPEPVNLAVECSASTLSLPIRPPRPEDVDLADFADPEGAPPAAATVTRPTKVAWRLSHDLGAGVHTLEVDDDSGRKRLDDIGLEIDLVAVERYTHQDDDPTSARGEVSTTRSMARDGWVIETSTTTALSSTTDQFVIDAELVASENGAEVFHRSWHAEIPRDLV